MAKANESVELLANVSLSGERMGKVNASMNESRMHEGEVTVDAALVRNMISEQFPQWSQLEVKKIRPSGTVNTIYRLGDEMYVRLPRLETGVSALQKELQWLPHLVDKVTLSVPSPIAQGDPTDEYPFHWAVYKWLHGETFNLELIDAIDTAKRLANFVSQLRMVDSTDAPRSLRCLPLQKSDDLVGSTIRQLRGVIDTDAVMVLWDTCLKSPCWDGVSVFTHGDLLPSNLLVYQNRLNAIIDFGSLGVGDPAVDVIPAWSVFENDDREAFRTALDVDDATWTRAKGLALRQALLIIPYYPETNPQFVELAKRTVERVLLDSE